MYSHSIYVPNGVVTGCKQIVVGFCVSSFRRTIKMSFVIVASAALRVGRIVSFVLVAITQSVLNNIYQFYFNIYKNL